MGEIGFTPIKQPSLDAMSGDGFLQIILTIVILKIKTVCCKKINLSKNKVWKSLNIVNGFKYNEYRKVACVAILVF
jgi:hypothetical protein